MKPAATVTLVFLVAIAVLHAARLALQVDVAVAGALIPQWASVFGILGPSLLAIWLRREQHE
jgi:hypothetical protein